MRARRSASMRARSSSSSVEVGAGAGVGVVAGVEVVAGVGVVAGLGVVAGVGAWLLMVAIYRSAVGVVASRREGAQMKSEAIVPCSQLSVGLYSRSSSGRRSVASKKICFWLGSYIAAAAAAAAATTAIAALQQRDPADGRPRAVQDDVRAG